MDCYTSSTEGSEKQTLKCFFFLHIHLDPNVSPLKEGTQCNTYSGEGVVQVVNSPGNDYNVVNVKPEGQDSCCKAHTYHTGKMN